LAVALTVVFAAPSPASISPGVLDGLKSHGSVDIVVNLHQKTSSVLSSIKHQSFATQGARVKAVASSLQALAASSQKHILAYLASQGIQARSLWISNQIGVKGAYAQLVHALAAMPEVESIIADKVTLAPLPAPSAPFTETPAALQWGVEMVDAPGAWAQGYTGKDVVVGILDTGVRYTHKLLYPNYRHERGWLDASSANSQVPVDHGGHGTHVMGSIVGKDGVGVAPEANWIACKTSMTFGALTEYQRCGQFLLCPTLPDETEPDCDAHPHVVIHSWGFFTDKDHDFMDASIEAWNTAGIFVVWANGNEGTRCSSARYPSATGYDIFTVGATNSSDNLASFSSRGPGMWSGAGHIKPNIAAPGVNIVSCSASNDESLTTMSGTSMAAPHTAGVIALLLTNNTQEYSFGELSSFIFESASQSVPPTGGNCGGIPETVYPNNAAGHGRINAAAAVTRLQASRK